MGEISHGMWAHRVEHAEHHNLDDTVINALSDAHFGPTDTAAIIVAYRAAIDAALPNGVSLRGEEFFGPAEPAPGAFDGFDLDEDGRLDIDAIIRSIDFYGIAERIEETRTT